MDLSTEKRLVAEVRQLKHQQRPALELYAKSVKDSMDAQHKVHTHAHTHMHMPNDPHKA